MLLILESWYRTAVGQVLLSSAALLFRTCLEILVVVVEAAAAAALILLCVSPVALLGPGPK